MNQQRLVVFTEGGYHKNGIYILDGSLEPAKDHIPVLSPRGEAGRIIGLASLMRRDQTGELSFCITLEEHLNHDNFSWELYFTQMEFEDIEGAIIKNHRMAHPHRALSSGKIQALIARHVRYIPKEIPE